MFTTKDIEKIKKEMEAEGFLACSDQGQHTSRHPLTTSLLDLILKETRQEVHSHNMTEYKNNTYLLEVDGEIVEMYIPSPEEEAAIMLKEKSGKKIRETHQELYNGQRMDKIEDQQFRWGTPRSA
jgi:hypothetical protein